MKSLDQTTAGQCLMTGFLRERALKLREAKELKEEFINYLENRDNEGVEMAKAEMEWAMKIIPRLDQQRRDLIAGVDELMTENPDNGTRRSNTHISATMERELSFGLT